QANQGPLMQTVMGGISDVARNIVASHPDPTIRLRDASSYLIGRFGEVTPPRRRTAALQQLVTTGRFSRILEIQRLLEKSQTVLSRGDAKEAIRLTERAMSFKEARSPAARIVAFNVYQDAGNNELAFQTLKGADPAMPGPINFYHTLAYEYGYRGDRSSVFDIFQRARRQLPDRKHIYPSEIMVYRQLQDANSMHRSLGECRASGDADLIKACQAVAAGRQLDDAFRNDGGIIATLAGTRRPASQQKVFAPGQRRHDQRPQGQPVPSSPSGPLGQTLRTVNTVRSILSGIF
ncbi:MAG: tetratricopeptide repeat protein, partial [Pseudomonadota bacterium]